MQYITHVDCLFVVVQMARFTKVTAENDKKGFEDAHNRFRCVCKIIKSVFSFSNDIYLISLSLGDAKPNQCVQILKCYAENKGQTMSCSSIASLYIQCVDRARQVNYT